MYEDNKIIPSDVNDTLQQTKKKVECHERNLLDRLQTSTSSLPPTLMPTPLQIDTNETCPQQLKISFKHLADIKKINISKANVSPGHNNMPGTSLCNMCCRKDDVCVNLQNNHTTVLTVSDITRLPSWDIRQVLSSVCSRCLVYISAITESSSKLRLRCEQAMHSQTVVIAPPTPDTSPNNFLQVATSLDDTHGHSSSVKQQRNCYAPSYCDETANEISMAFATSSPPPAENSTFEAISRSPSPNNAGQNSMLKIHHERPVSPLNTESGGGKNSKRSYQRIQVIPVQMICTHCNRAYWRKDYYRKHVRRCSAKYRYAKSVAPQHLRSASRLELDAISVVSEGNEQIVTRHQPRIYRCNICAVTVESISKLRQHKRIHLPRFYCDICSGEYTSQNEYDFHRVLCAAKKEVIEKGLSEIKNGVDTSNNMPCRRKTRSFSRALSVAPSLAPSKAASTKTTNTTNKTKTTRTTAKRSRTRKEDVPKQTKPDDQQSTITNYVKRHKSLYGDADQSMLNERALNTYKNNDKDEEDDDVSEVDTLYSKRLTLTNQWVEEHSISSQSHLSQGDNYMNDFVEDIPFQSLKEYDLYLLERLKIEVRLNSLTCFVPDCKFICSTLNEMMVHDYIDHYKKPWFYCRKCGCCFTSKVFLDYHLDLQNKGRYVCYKCGGHFEYQHQLDRHLIQHSRLASIGGEKYICHFCNFKFLDEDKLMKHCHYENHDWNKKKHMIEIDQSMTISNKVPRKSNKRSKNQKYQVKILNMVLKLTPSKRCTPMEKFRLHLPLHLRIPNRIGQVEFRHSLNPNCVGCL